MGSLPADLPLTGMSSDLKREIHVGGTHGAFFSLCADEDRVRGTNDRRMPGAGAPAVAYSPKIEASGEPEQ